MHAQILFCLKLRKKIPFLGYTLKIRELSIIPVGIINYSHLGGKNCVICPSTVMFLLIFVPSIFAIQLHRCDNLQLVRNCLCQIFWLTFFVCFDSGKKVAISVHAWKKIMYATQEEHGNSHSCFCALASLVRNFTLVRIILFLPCSINIYFIPEY